MELLREEIGNSEAKSKDPEWPETVATSAVRTLENYSKASSQRIEQSQQGWKDIIRELLRFVDQGGATVRSAHGMFELLEKDLSAAAGIADVHALRSRLRKCIADAAERAAAQPGPTTELKRLSSKMYANAAPQEIDPTTGLPGSLVASQAVGAVWERRENRYLVAFVLERLESINVRFGVDAGDQIIRNYSQNLAQNLDSSDQLFRWSGPCLLALIEREQPEGLVAAEMARACAVRLEETIVVGHHELIVPASPTWSVFALEQYPTPQEACSKVDEFVDERQLASFRAASGRR